VPGVLVNEKKPSTKTVLEDARASTSKPGGILGAGSVLSPKNRVDKNPSVLHSQSDQQGA